MRHKLLFLFKISIVLLCRVMPYSRASCLQSLWSYPALFTSVCLSIHIPRTAKTSCKHNDGWLARKCIRCLPMVFRFYIWCVFGVAFGGTVLVRLFWNATIEYSGMCLIWRIFLFVCFSISQCRTHHLPAKVYVSGWSIRWLVWFLLMKQLPNLTCLRSRCASDDLLTWRKGCV